jgi:hypothetical protein
MDNNGTHKWLGKIQSIVLGYGGYQGACFGVTVHLSGNSVGVNDFKGTWSSDVECTEHSKWTEEDRSKLNDETMRFINKIIKDAKVKTLDELQGIPVEVTIKDFNSLDSWRVLTEVL